MASLLSRALGSSSGVTNTRERKFTVGGKITPMSKLPSGETQLSGCDIAAVESVSRHRTVRSAMRQLLNEVATRPQFGQVVNGKSVPLQTTPKFDKVMRMFNEPQLLKMYETYFKFGLLIYTRGLSHTALHREVSHIVVPTERFIITVANHRGIVEYKFYWDNRESASGNRAFPEYRKVDFLLDTSVVVVGIDSTAPGSDGRLQSIMSELIRDHERLQLAENLQEVVAVTAASNPFAIVHNPAPAASLIPHADFEAAINIVQGIVADPAQGEDANVHKKINAHEFVNHLRAVHHGSMQMAMRHIAAHAVAGVDPEDEVGKLTASRLVRALQTANALRAEGRESVIGTVPTMPSEWDVRPLPAAAQIMDPVAMSEALTSCVYAAFGLESPVASGAGGRAEALAEAVHRRQSDREQRLSNLREAVAPYFLDGIKRSVADTLGADQQYTMALMHTFVNQDTTARPQEPEQILKENMIKSIVDMFVAEEDEAVRSVLTADSDALYDVVVNHDPILSQILAKNPRTERTKEESKAIEEAARNATRVQETIDLYQNKIFEAWEGIKTGKTTKPVKMGTARYKKKTVAPGPEVAELIPMPDDETPVRPERPADTARPGSLLRALLGSRGYARTGVVAQTPGRGKQMTRIAKHLYSMQMLSSLTISFTSKPETRMKIATALAAGAISVDDARQHIAASHGGHISTMRHDRKMTPSQLINNLLYIDTEGKNGILDLDGEKVYSSGQPDPTPQPMEVAAPSSSSSKSAAKSAGTGAKSDANDLSKTSSSSKKKADKKRKRDTEDDRNKKDDQTSSQRRSKRGKPNKSE
jgi:hypothetical protein